MKLVFLLSIFPVQFGQHSLEPAMRRILILGLPLLHLIFAGCSSPQQILFSEGEKQLRELAYAQAYATFTRYLSISPVSPGGYYNRGLAAAGMGKYLEALSDFSQAIRLDPDDTDARRMRFRIQSERRRTVHEDSVGSPVLGPIKQTLEAALTVIMLDELDGILKIEPNDIWALNERGRLWHEGGNYDMALADYDAALVYCDTCTWLLYNKALSLKGKGSVGEAVTVLRQAIELNELDGEAWLMLGECYALLGRHRDACRALSRSARLGVPEAQDRFDDLCR